MEKEEYWEYLDLDVNGASLRKEQNMDGTFDHMLVLKCTEDHTLLDISEDDYKHLKRVFEKGRW